MTICSLINSHYKSFQKSLNTRYQPNVAFQTLRRNDTAIDAVSHDICSNITTKRQILFCFRTVAVENLRPVIHIVI